MAGPMPSPEMYTDWRSWANALLSYLGFAQPEVRMPPFPSTGLPDATRAKYQIILVRDVSPQKPAYSDGTIWRYFDGTAV